MEFATTSNSMTRQDFPAFVLHLENGFATRDLSIDDWWSMIGEEFCGIGEVINPYNWECLEVSAFVSDTDLATTAIVLFSGSILAGYNIR